MAAGRLVIGANETTSLYLMQHIVNYRRQYPKVKVQVRRSFSSPCIPSQLIDGDLELVGHYLRIPRTTSLAHHLTLTTSASSSAPSSLCRAVNPFRFASWV